MLLVYGACQAVCWLITIPMYVYGKRTRSFVSVRRSCSSSLLGNLLRPGMMLHRSPGILNFSIETFSRPVPRRRRRHLRRGPMRRTENTIGNPLFSRCSFDSRVTLCSGAVRFRVYRSKDRIVGHARLSICFEACVQTCIQI